MNLNSCVNYAHFRKSGHICRRFPHNGKPTSNEYTRNMTIMEETCVMAGLPLEPQKTTGPSTTIIFLGIELDSVNLQNAAPLE